VNIKPVIAVVGVAIFGFGFGAETGAKAPTPQASRMQEIKDLNDLPAVLSEGQGKRTLLVLDIDDTLLTSPEFFGSDGWYEWQRALPDGNPDKIRCLYDVIAMNYESGVQVATQADGPSIINSLKFDKIIQTSRSLASRAATIRELLDAGYDLPPTLAQKIDGKLYQLNPADPKSATISYHRGIYMGGGQDKGTLLSRLIDEGSLQYDRIVFVDDGFKNIESMRVAMEARKVEYRGLFFTRISKAVTPDKERLAEQGWVEWQQLFALTFPGRFARMNAGKCGY
jgi:hypothetical protein